MKTWEEIMPEVEEIVETNTDLEEVLDLVSALRDKDTSYNALRRAWKRHSNYHTPIIEVLGFYKDLEGEEEQEEQEILDKQDLRERLDSITNDLNDARTILIELQGMLGD